MTPADVAGCTSGVARSGREEEADGFEMESGVYPKIAAGAPIDVSIVDPLFSIHDVLELGHASAQICVRVLQHLAEEEAPDGLLAAIEEHAPRLAPRVAELRADHRELRALASTAFRYASLKAPAALQHVALEWLGEAMRVHTTRERAVFQEALLDDLGGESGLAPG